MEKRSFLASRWLRRSAALAVVLAFLAAAFGAVFAPAAEAAGGPVAHARTTRGQVAHAGTTRGQVARATGGRGARARAVYPTAAEQRRCHADEAKTVVCVDQNAQRLWVVRGKSVIFGPVTVRTGRRGHLTRTGTFHIYWRHRHHWSTLYDAPMPYAQFFSGGEALHGVYGDLNRGPGSYGCVNLTVHDAARLWPLTRKGTVVKVWGHRPGT